MKAGGPDLLLLMMTGGPDLLLLMMTGGPDLLPMTAMSRNIGLCALITGGPQCSRDLPLALIGICAIPGGPALSRGLPFAHDDLCPR